MADVILTSVNRDNWFTAVREYRIATGAGLVEAENTVIHVREGYGHEPVVKNVDPDVAKKVAAQFIDHGHEVLVVGAESVSILERALEKLRVNKPLTNAQAEAISSHISTLSEELEKTLSHLALLRGAYSQSSQVDGTDRDLTLGAAEARIRNGYRALGRELGE